MTQIDPPATFTRLAGRFEMTYPAGRLIYLPSLHATSGKVNLELSTSTLTSLAKPLTGWVHASQVIKMQMYTLILLSIVIQSATSSYGIDHRPGDPGSHIIAYPTAGIETPTLMQCSAKPPDSSYQPVRQVSPPSSTHSGQALPSHRASHNAIHHTTPSHHILPHQ